MEADKSKDVQGKSASWECQRCSCSVKASWLQTQEEPMFQFKSEGKKKSMPSLRVSGRKKFSLPQRKVSFFVLFRPSTVSMRPNYIREAICFIQSINLNVNLIPKHSHRHTQNNVLAASWATLSPVSLTQKMNHHNSLD